MRTAGWSSIPSFDPIGTEDLRRGAGSGGMRRGDRHRDPDNDWDGPNSDPDPDLPPDSVTS